MESKRSRVRHAFDDGGRLSTAFRRIVAKMPSRLTRDGSLNLCQRCKELNSGCVFKTPRHSHRINLDLALGILDEDSPCTLCRIFYSMRRPSITGKTTGIYYLRRCTLEEPIRSIKPGVLLEIITSTVWIVDPDSGPLGWEWDGIERFYQQIITSPQSLFISQSTKSFLRPEATLKGLPVYETSVNYPLLRYWIKECEGHPYCSYLSTDYCNPRTRPVIRGIDCISRRIVDLQPGGKYIALSYVWGNKPLLENKGSRVLPANVPKVIEDAMVVVKELGQRYLWVDQYCIDQQDDQDKHAQIKNMDRIYEGSHATIVAFSGVDSSSGLPGVSSIPRTRQHRFTSSKVTLLGFTPSITRQSLDASIWMKRGWTFQEALLSRRLLIFTQEQVYFLCSRGWSAESCAPRRRMIGEDAKHIRGFSSFLSKASMNLISPLTRMPFDESIEVRVKISHLLDLIREFTRRQLSFQSDALDAVRGLLSRVPILTYWGIPFHDFVKHRKAQVGFSFDPLEANALFLQCLFWQPDREATEAEYLGRRERFPSWSWLGWRIPVTFGSFCNLKDLRSPVKVEETDGTLLFLIDLFRLSRAGTGHASVLPERTAYLWLEGLVMTLGFQPVGRNRHDGKLCFCFDHPLGCSYYLTEGSCAPDGRYNEVSFRLDVKGSEEIWKATLVKKWSCLWIYSIYGRHEFLILDEGDDAAYCVGTLLLVDPTEDKGMLDNLKAKVPHEYRKVRVG